MMRIEYGLGHRDGKVSGPYPTEEEMWKQVVIVGGIYLGRVITTEKIGPWKDLDMVHGLCYANPIYNNSA